MTEFVRADSTNIPKIDIFMLIDYLKSSDKYNDADLRGVKVLMSSRDSYIDNAVGYVEIKRERPSCIIKARVVPEHRITSKPYSVSAIIEEKEEKIIDSTCMDCPASAGGCKHALVLLFWLQKKSTEPSSTSVECYWTKPALGNLQKQHVLAEDVYKCTRKMERGLKNENTLSIFLEECKKHKTETSLLNNHFATERNSFSTYCIFNLLLSYHAKTNDTDYENFKNFCATVFTDDVKKKIENQTKSQADNIKWHMIRQGRVTASKLHELSVCKTGEGSLVQEILGGHKFIETKAMKRGKILENKVIKKLQDSLQIKVNNAGFYIYDAIFGASPDGIYDNKKCIVEIKCPSKESTVKMYFNSNANQITRKCMAQVQLQMHCTKIKKCLFCVADPMFEINEKLTILFIDYDENYITTLLEKSESFYIKHIYPKLVKSVLK